MATGVFISRRVRLSTCAKCGVSLWQGIAEGLPFKVDPVPVTVQGELVARLADRWSYGWEKWTWCCYYRDQWRMRQEPRPAVLVDHRCGSVLVDYMDSEWLVAISNVIAEQKRMPEEEDEMSETEQDALMTVSHVLGARILDEECPF